MADRGEKQKNTSGLAASNLQSLTARPLVLSWKSLYDAFDLDFESGLDLSEPDEYWERYLYFNAGYFFNACPHAFGEKFLHYALTIRDTPPETLVALEICESFGRRI